jgi:hypothetical protein
LGAPAPESPQQASLALALAIATGSRRSGLEPQGPTELRIGVEVSDLLDSKRVDEAVRRATEGTEHVDAGPLAWTIRSIAEDKAGRWRAAVDSALQARQRDPAAAEPEILLPRFIGKRLVPLSWLAWFLTAFGLFALGAAQSEEALEPIREYVMAAGWAALLAAAGVFFTRRRLGRSLPDAVQGTVAETTAFRYRQVLLMASIALPVVWALIPGPGRPAAIAFALPGLLALAVTARGIYRSPVRLKPMLAFALTGLAIHERHGPNGGRQPWWTRDRRAAPDPARDSSVDLGD